MLARMTRLMVRHRDADDLARCPRFHQKNSVRERGAELPSPGLVNWRCVVDAITAAHRAGDALTFEGVKSHIAPPGGVWECAEQRAEIEMLVEAYLEAADELGGEWLDPPTEKLQLPSKAVPVVLEGSLHLTFDHGSDEVEVRKVEISDFHVPPDGEALRTEFSTCILTLLTHNWLPRPRTRVTLVSLRARRAVSCVWDESELPLAGAVVREWTHERLQRSDFAATRNALCTSCGYARSCPAIPHLPCQEPTIRFVLTGQPSLAVRPSTEPWSVFSPSRFRLHEQCARRYRNRHVLGLSGEAGRDTDESSHGLAVHRVLAEVHALDPLGHRGLDSLCERVAGEMDVDAEMVRANAATHVELCPGDEYLGGEVDLFAFDDDAGLLLTGRADAVWRSRDGGVEVRDYKTGSAALDLSIDIYAVLAAASFPGVPIRVALEDLTEARVVSREFGQSQLAQARARIRAAALAISDEHEFLANPGPLCATCPYNGSCPEALV